MAHKSEDTTATDNIQQLLGDEGLAIFLRSMRKFDQAFCQLMTTGEQFTLRIEVHGGNGRLVHCRVYQDAIERPQQKH